MTFQAMPYSTINDLPPALRERASIIKLAVFDVDGVLTDGGLLFDQDGREGKRFHAHDGLGLKLLMQYGIEVALITARDSSIVANRARELGITHFYQGIKNKREQLQTIAEQLQIPFHAIAYTGDDLPDLSCLSAVGLAVAVANAHPWIRERVHFRTQHAGGHGAAREVCDLILAAQGHAQSIIDGAIQK